MVNLTAVRARPVRSRGDEEFSYDGLICATQEGKIVVK
jgi:hypothetical protein